MTLVELMVAMTIGLGITLAITSILITSENHKRTTTSTNDAEQNGAYAFYSLDRVLRGAGSAFAESVYPTDRGILGCKLNAKSILPAAAFPDPFANTLDPGPSTGLRVAPLLIAPGKSQGGSDVIVVMSGSGAAGAVPRQITDTTGDATTLKLDSTLGIAASTGAAATADLALVSQSAVVGGDCLVEQIHSAAGSTLNLSTTDSYYLASATTTTLASLATNTSTYVTPIGNAAANNAQFLMYGVGTNRTLYSYDLLQNVKMWQNGGVGTEQPQAIADGVDQMYAIYGIDNDANGTQDTWISPTAAGYDVNTVMTNELTMRKIVSIRVALVVRGEYGEKSTNAAVTTQLKLFSGLTDSTGTPLPALEKDIAVTGDDQHYRYRVFEFTVPLRNMILLAAGAPP
jgi:type IV pilus assembly protein PilW